MKKSYEKPLATPVRLIGADILSTSDTDWELPIIPGEEEF